MEAVIPGDRLLLPAGTQASNQPPGGGVILGLPPEQSAYRYRTDHDRFRQHAHDCSLRWLTSRESAYLVDGMIVRTSRWKTFLRNTLITMFNRLENNANCDFRTNGERFLTGEPV